MNLTVKEKIVVRRLLREMRRILHAHEFDIVCPQQGKFDATHTDACLSMITGMATHLGIRLDVEPIEPIRNSPVSTGARLLANRKRPRRMN